MIGPRPAAPPAVALAAALALLWFALTFDNAWPGAGIVPAPALSIEMLVVVLVLVRVASRRHTAPPRALGALAAVYLLFTVLHYVDVTVPALFGRPINLFWDGRHLPQVLRLAASEQPAPRLVAIVAAVAIGSWAAWRLLRWALRIVWRAAASARQPAGAITGLSALLMATLALRLAGGEAGIHHVAQPVSTVYARQASWLASIAWPGAIDRWLPASPPFAGDLRALAGADVMLTFVESYGATTYDDPARAAALAPARAALGQAIAGSGRQVVSAFVRSPTFGGGSWLAHSSLLSGIDMHEPERYALLLASTRPSLVGHFRRHGYRTVALMPGLRTDWPEGAFYGFDILYDSRTLGYDGPAFGFWRIPDQYSIGRVHELELAPPSPRPPRFIVFPTINSHIPFDPVPPLAIDPDRPFTQALDPQAVARSIAVVPDWTNPAPAYARSIDYSLRWLAAYVAHRAPGDLMLIVLGDHQPAASVTGRGAGWEVPVHIVSHRRDLLDRLLAAGFREGLEPARPALGAMHDLTALLLSVFDGCGAGAASTAGALAGSVAGSVAEPGARPGPRSTAGVDPGCDPPRVDVPGPGIVRQRGDPVPDRVGALPLAGAQAQRLAD